MNGYVIEQANINLILGAAFIAKLCQHTRTKNHVSLSDQAWLCLTLMQFFLITNLGLSTNTWPSANMIFDSIYCQENTPCGQRFFILSAQMCNCFAMAFYSSPYILCEVVSCFFLNHFERQSSITKSIDKGILLGHKLPVNTTNM